MLFVASVVSLLSVCFACSPEGEAGLPEAGDLVGKTYHSQAVVIGRVVMIYPTPRLSPNAYTVNLQVDCVVKDVGGKMQGLGRTINITEAGFIEGMCHSAEFKAPYAYIAFLREDFSGRYKPWEMPAENTADNRDLVMKTCGITPRGRQCPAPAAECDPDVNGYSRDSYVPRQNDEHMHDDEAHHHADDHDPAHHEDHAHHADEDASYSHSHADHHTGDHDFDHDHDHSDHHHDDDEHGHMHDHDHTHDHDDHDHHDHHHDEGEFNHDHDHSDHHDDKESAKIVESSGHRDAMTTASVFLVLVLSYLLQ